MIDRVNWVLTNSPCFGGMLRTGVKYSRNMIQMVGVKRYFKIEPIGSKNVQWTLFTNKFSQISGNQMMNSSELRNALLDAKMSANRIVLQTLILRYTRPILYWLVSILNQIINLKLIFIFQTQIRSRYKWQKRRLKSGTIVDVWCIHFVLHQIEAYYRYLVGRDVSTSNRFE